MADSNYSICFLADHHGLYDDRIYWKMAMSLKKAGYSISYVLMGNEAEKGTTDHDIDYTIIKRTRFSKNPYLNFILKKLFRIDHHQQMLKIASELKADVYHFHDLRINKIAPQLKSLSHQPVVIYDAREPYAADIRSYLKEKPLLSPFRKLYARYMDHWEKKNSKHYDLVITNEELLRDEFREIFGKNKAEVIYNYTDNYQDYKAIPFKDKTYDFIYSGTITKLRGALKIIEAAGIAVKTIPELKGLFVGSYFPPALKDEMLQLIHKKGLENNLSLMDKVPYDEIADYYNQTRIGMVTLLPVETFYISMPIKIFEYSTFALPMIGSNFGHMKKYIEKDESGITVDPLDAKQIADGMIQLLTDQHLYQQLANNGRSAAISKYRWDLEEKRLLHFYAVLLNTRTNNEYN